MSTISTLSSKGSTQGSVSPGKTRANLTPQDKGAIVLDIGYMYTRIGLSGEPSPRHVIRSQVSMKPYGEMMNVWDQKYTKREELYLILCRFFSKIYLQYLLLSSQEYRVVIVESFTCPSHVRNTLAKVLFLHFGVPHICFLPLHLSCLFLLGRLTALVVDIGHKEATVLPAYEGIPIIKAWQVTGCAVQTYHSYLKQLLKEQCKATDKSTGAEVPVSTCSSSLTANTLSDIAVKTCFIRPLFKGDQLPPDVSYPVDPIYSLCVNGYVRCHAADILFEDYCEDLNIPTCVLDALIECPVDCRRELAENVILIGGGACLTGMNWRLKEELDKLVQQSKYKALEKLNFKFHSLPSSPNYTAWQGASILGAIEVAVLERSVSKDEFKQKGSLPEWMSCNPEQWENLRSILTRKLPTSSSQHRRVTPKIAVLQSTQNS